MEALSKGPFTFKRVPLTGILNSSKNDYVKQGQLYLVRSKHAPQSWYIGKASQVWFGWNFNVGSYVMQLSSVGELYEMIET